MWWISRENSIPIERECLLVREEFPFLTYIFEMFFFV